MGNVVERIMITSIDGVEHVRLEHNDLGVMGVINLLKVGKNITPSMNVMTVYDMSTVLYAKDETIYNVWKDTDYYTHTIYILDKDTWSEDELKFIYRRVNKKNFFLRLFSSLLD